MKKLIENGASMEPSDGPDCSGITLHELVVHGEAVLSAVSSSARLDAELLCAHICGLSRSSLVAHFSDKALESQRADFLALLVRREAGEPVAYILGKKEFWNLSFVVSPAVLVPRPESELVVEEALDICRGLPAPQIVDLGTGSGCLAITIVHELKKRKEGCAPRCVAVDISEAALGVARENAALNGVENEITFVHSNWFSCTEEFSPPYDLIVANPPYIRVEDAASVPRELTFEPQMALFSGCHGLEDTFHILQQALPKLRPGGFLLIEVGAGKRELLREFFTTAEFPYSYQFLGDDRDCDSFTVVKVQK